MKCKIMLVVVAGLLVAAGKPPKRGAKKDAARMEGTWEVVEAVQSGEPLKDKERADFRVRFKGTKMIITQKGKAHEATFTLKPAKPYNQIDLVPQDGKFKGKKFRGIYQFDKADKLNLFFADPGRERPSKIASTADSGTMALYLERKKK